MTQLPLTCPTEYFYGEWHGSEDAPRWSRHCAAVLEVLRSGGWWTYEALGRAAGVPVGSCRTRVSNLRKRGVAIEARINPSRFVEVRLA